MKVSNLTKLSVVLRSVLKPDWNRDIWLLDSKNQVKCLQVVSKFVCNNRTCIYCLQVNCSSQPLHIYAFSTCIRGVITKFSAQYASLRFIELKSLSMVI